MAALMSTPDATMAVERIAHITDAQKQALIDNLQLEIADRARKLRAQYALQAQGLRTRLEMRINRIPRPLRRANMGDLLQKHLDAQNRVQHAIASPVKAKTLKRKSDNMTMENKENTEPALKKRSQPSIAATAISSSPNPARQKISHPLNPTILSPKSPNSRTLPRSPLKSPQHTKSPPPLPRPRGTATQQSTLPNSKGTIKRPATAPTRAHLDSATTSTLQRPASIRRPLRPSNASAESTSSEKTTIVNRSPAKSIPLHRPHTAMAMASSPYKKLPVPTSPVKHNTLKEKPLPVASSAPVSSVVGTIKKGTFKSAMASLTGSKKGKKTTPATAASAFVSTTPSGTPPPAGRVLRKRAL